MDIRFVEPELRELDALRCEALALPLYSDERPLRGALGLVDWRMCGLVSRLVVRGQLSGLPGETMLLPGRPKLSMDKLFVFGLGPEAELREPDLEAVVAHMLDTVARAGVRTTALALPGRVHGSVDATSAMEAFVAAATPRDEHDEVVLLEFATAHKEMQRVLERQRRRARADLSPP
ncbi:MAG: hypothetical protein OEZ06_29740 [Myxococcales bacterium]|nr:hypothetical protein [Myxococcales bacterium]